MANTLEQPAHKEFTSGDYQWYSNLPLQPNLDYYVDYEDFNKYAAADWTVTETAGNSTQALVTTDGLFGQIVLTNDVNDNDNLTFQRTFEGCQLAVGYPCWFEVKLKTDDADNCDLFAGIAITDTTPNDATDKIGFSITDGDASINFVATKNSTSTTEDTEIDAADSTFIKLGFYWDGSNKVTYFVNRVAKGEVTTNIPDDESMKISYWFQNGSAAARALTIDYSYYCAKR